MGGGGQGVRHLGIFSHIILFFSDHVPYPMIINASQLFDFHSSLITVFMTFATKLSEAQFAVPTFSRGPICLGLICRGPICRCLISRIKNFQGPKFLGANFSNILV